MKYFLHPIIINLSIIIFFIHYLPSFLKIINNDTIDCQKGICVPLLSSCFWIGNTFQHLFLCSIWLSSRTVCFRRQVIGCADCLLSVSRTGSQESSDNGRCRHHARTPASINCVGSIPTGFKMCCNNKKRFRLIYYSVPNIYLAILK